MDSLGNIADENIMSSTSDLLKTNGETMIYQNEKFIYSGTGNPESLIYTTTPEHSSNEVAIAIFDTLLQMQTFKQWGGTGFDQFNKILVDSNDDYLLLGASMSLNFDLPGNYNSGERFDFWLSKVDKELNLVWSKNFGGSYSNGDLGGGRFFGNMVLSNNKRYCFLQVVVPDILPDYDISCGVSEGIAFFDAWIVAFDLPTSIVNLPITNDIQVFPNPNAGSFTIESSLLKSACVVALYSLDGKIA